MAQLALGLMSGTSCDGISAALVRFQRQTLRVLAEHTQPYPLRVSRVLRRAPTLTAPELSMLNMVLGEQFARAAQRVLRAARMRPTRLAVIGSHGHTIYHGPGDAIPSTLQLGEPCVIAERLGVPVVADFRPRDLAAGGCGAPLVPAFDEAFFGKGVTRALQNLGGVGNVTVVGRAIDAVAFDTGPGNCLMDLVVQQMSRGRMRFDAHGHLALRGRIDHRAVERMWRQPYFRQPPPKSTGRELFNEAWLRQMFSTALARAPLDVLATLTYFTAYSIAESYRRFIRHRLHEVIVSGGGAHNRTLMRHLARLLAPVPVHSIERYGIPAQAKEPVAFAFLALQALRHRANHLPHTTGARGARILGSVTPGQPA
ncbi:MAG: anhydro-N-acetylmuramic acid kinase [Candidatus Omnitrophica bacterium CG11_big_fil_rev_8_21_14_0_20_63_9]|nr:MAG: anhydro-N-acetylmuramic acid kinase [Candidatus Omnitrophica bacterium CG11_big_fil_rev_8_21_14_0_20_63_9]